MSRRVLVTGATGFVGAALTPALLAAGWSVRAAGRRPAPGAEHVAIDDLAGGVDWRPALAGVEAVIHAAGLAHAGPGEDEARYDAVNRRATLALAEAAAGRVGRFVFLSSIRAQSGPVSHATLEEAMPLRPTDAYGRSKAAAEAGLARLDLPWVALRPVLVHGAGARANLAAMLRIADTPLPLPLAGLAGRRSLVALPDVVSAVLLALEHAGAARCAFNVAAPDALTAPEMIRALRSGLGRPARLLPAPKRLLRAAAGLLGQGDAWARLDGALVASSLRLQSLGWRPAEATPAALARTAAEWRRLRSG